MQPYMWVKHVHAINVWVDQKTSKKILGMQYALIDGKDLPQARPRKWQFCSECSILRTKKRCTDFGFSFYYLIEIRAFYSSLIVAMSW